MIRLSAFRRLSPALVLLAASLAACGGTTAPPPPTNVAGAFDTALATAAQLLIAYEGLAPCPTNAPLCQSPEVLGGLKAKLTAANNALIAGRPIVLSSPPGSSAYQTTITDIEAAIAALTAFEASNATLSSLKARMENH